MELTSNSMWMVRAGRGGAYISHFLGNGVAAIGWAEVGEIESDDSDEDVLAAF